MQGHGKSNIPISNNNTNNSNFNTTQTAWPAHASHSWLTTQNCHYSRTAQIVTSNKPLWY